MVIGSRDSKGFFFAIISSSACEPEGMFNGLAQQQKQEHDDAGNLEATKVSLG